MAVQEIDTLVHLLDDPDAVVYGAVASHFLGQGIDTIPHLEKVWAHSRNANIRERIETIIRQIHLQDALQGMQQWIDGQQHNLLEGAYWIAKQHYPDLRLPQLQNAIDDILKDIWVATSDETLPILNKLNIFNHLFYRTHLYTQTAETLNPAYCFINRVLETKCGNGISLGLLYLHLAQQAGFPMYGVCLPGAFLLAYTKASGEVVCYVNPFKNGSWAGKREVTDYLQQRGFTCRPEYYTPCDNVTVILRLTEYIVFAYEQENKLPQADIYRAFLSLFGNRITHFIED
ncbi:MAG: transglutaminase-like domain-containing protein [Prevotellaceae bacterium]|jgi:regulator of sirC expression with transglutaminase-like and TPR domain|nr:transglutaminase-like domain-containing protein [Prevotellaceae bacterium]